MSRKYKCKCKYCGDELTTDIAHKIVFKNKNIYFCNQLESELFLDEQKQIEQDNLIWNDIYEFIKLDILGYDSMQQLPIGLIQRLKDLRNGSIMQKGVGRVVKSKSGYPYEVILNTLKKCHKDIRYFLANKQFNNESQRINYMMAIIDSNINNEYNRWKLESKHKESENKIDTYVTDLNIIETTTPRKTIIKKVGILEFLDEDDL